MNKLFIYRRLNEAEQHINGLRHEELNVWFTRFWISSIWTSTSSISPGCRPQEAVFFCQKSVLSRKLTKTSLRMRKRSRWFAGDFEVVTGSEGVCTNLFSVTPVVLRRWWERRIGHTLRMEYVVIFQDAVFIDHVYLQHVDGKWCGNSALSIV